MSHDREQPQPQPSWTSAFQPRFPRRECFITVGATASFLSLLDQALGNAFISALIELEYTHLTIQCGPDLAYARKIVQDQVPGAGPGIDWRNNLVWKGLKLKLFDFNKLGLGAEMKGCKGLGKGEREGVVVCHAGECSCSVILDFMYQILVYR